MIRILHLIAGILCSVAVISCGKKQQAESSPDFSSIPKIKPTIIKVLPHDTGAFTQGLFFYDGKLYESTGITGKSTIRIVDTNGMVLQSRFIPEVFAEGCALFGDLLYQITWQNQVCITYTLPDLKMVGTLQYQGEGWGLTSDSKCLYMSDGSNIITVRNREFEVLRTIPVTMAGKPLININELELVGTTLYANVWFSDFIFEIDLSKGSVTKIIDCSELVTKEAAGDEQSVLNGIACDNQGRFYITGKNWKNMFVISVQ
ncbi:MAG TPA: glutaminyl-peptide cyclotransferase [Chitinispirillaceae bacterium]|nr:glutaminyl-peptide cyclotransferase [Chitinispirillaceae bacterium]